MLGVQENQQGNTADAEEQGRRAGREADRTRGAGSGRALRATLRTSALSLSELGTRRGDEQKRTPSDLHLKTFILVSRLGKSVKLPVTSRFLSLGPGMSNAPLLLVDMRLLL